MNFQVKLTFGVLKLALLLYVICLGFLGLLQLCVASIEELLHLHECAVFLAKLVSNCKLGPLRLGLYQKLFFGLKPLGHLQRNLDLGSDETDFIKLSQGVCDLLTRSSDSLRSFVAQAKKLAGGAK